MFICRKKLKESCFDEVEYPITKLDPTCEQLDVETNFATKIKDINHCILSKIVLKAEIPKFSQDGTFLDYFIFPDDVLQLNDVRSERRRDFVLETNAIFRKCLLTLHDRSRTEKFISVFRIRDSVVILQSFRNISLRIINPPHSLNRMLESEDLVFSTGMSGDQDILCEDSITINSVFDLIHNEFCASASFICKIWCSTPFVNGTIKRPRIKLKSDFIELEGIIFGNLLTRIFPEESVVIHHERFV